jgi:hypothetical protein
METVSGGKLLSVTRENPDGTTATEQVKVRQLKIKEFPEYAAALDDEPKLASLLCSKTPGWADALTNESLEQIVREGKRINADFFERWCQRKRENIEVLNPGLAQALINQAASQLTTTLPTSPSKSA